MRRRELCAGALVLMALSGCETTGNVDPGKWTGPSPDKGLVVFSVTHDHGPNLLGRPSGANVRAYFHLRGPGFGQDGFRAFSLTDTLTPVIRSQFDDVWGTAYVRELPPGHYELHHWSILINTGVGTRELSPKAPPPLLGFEVRAGQSVYLGNFHVVIEWGTLLGLPMPFAGVATIGSRPERDLAVVYQSYPQLKDRVLLQPLPAQSPWLTPGQAAPTRPAPAGSAPQ